MNDYQSGREGSDLQALEERAASLAKENQKLQNELRDLRILEERFLFSKAFYDNQTIMAISRLEDAVFMDVNQTWADLLEYRRDEMIGRSAVELGVWAEPKQRMEMVIRLAQSGHISNFEAKYRKKSGDTGVLRLSSSILEIHHEKYLLISGVDITERKKAEEELRLSQNLFWQVFNSFPLAIIIVSMKDQRIVEVNDAFLKRNGKKRDWFVGRNNTHLEYWENPEEFEKYLKLVKKNGMVQNYEINYYLITGEKRTVLLSGVAISWQGEACMLSISNDITEIRRYQKEMARLENLHIIGQMAASIAHEIRNPMTSVRGYLQLFKGHDSFSQEAEAMDLMITELDRVNDIITIFLSLAQKNHINLKRQSLNGKINDLLPLLTADALKHGISIKTELADIDLITIDEGEFRQLLLNLVRNGIDAMSEGGQLTIKTFQDRAGVHMVVEDLGQGMTAEVLENIGKPFFTTKPDGTGLGLVICYSIADKHNARIDVSSSSEGTIFDVIFPAAQLQ